MDISENPKYWPIYFDSLDRFVDKLITSMKNKIFVDSTDQLENITWSNLSDFDEVIINSLGSPSTFKSFYENFKHLQYHNPSAYLNFSYVRYDMYMIKICDDMTRNLSDESIIISEN